VHAENPHNILLVLVPLVNVFLMVNVELLHTLLIDKIEPTKLQFTYYRCEDGICKSYILETQRIVRVNNTVTNIPMHVEVDGHG
jgi:hypothetical protein